jgi:hypothetical protein
MPRIFPIIRRITQGAGGVTNIVRVSVGILTRIVITLFNTAPQIVGFVIDAGHVTLTRLQRLGISITTVIDGTPSDAVIVTGLVVAPENSGSADVPLGVTGIGISRIQYDLVHRSGGNASSEENGCTGRQDWTDVAQAEGLADGLTATMQGNALGARDGILVLNYANFTNKSELVISQVLLRFICGQSGTVLNNGNHDHRWRKNGGAWTVLQIYTGNHQADESVGEIYDITASITGWSDLDGLETGVRQCMDIGENFIIANVDAVEVDITAAKVDTL